MEMTYQEFLTNMQRYLAEENDQTLGGFLKRMPRQEMSPRTVQWIKGFNKRCLEKSS